MAALATCGAMAGVLLFSAAPALATEGLGVISTFGGPGSGDGELSLQPVRGEGGGSGIAVNSVGYVYVADTQNNRVEWFDSAGKYEGQFNGSEIDGVPAAAGKQAPTKLSAPKGIAVDNDPASPSFGDVYVEDPSEGVVDKFSATGEFLFQFEVGETRGIAIDPSGDVWVISFENATATEFNDAVKNARLASVSVKGFGEGLAVDSEDNLYVMWGGEVSKYSKAGARIGGGYHGTGITIDPATDDLFVDSGTSVAQYGPFGEPFEAPIYSSKPDVLVSGAGIIAVSPANHEVYVADAGSNHIVVLAHGSGPQAPETLPATEEESKSVILHGKLSPLSTEYYFEYNTGESCTGGSRTPLKQGDEGEVVSEEVTKLEPSAEYTFCLVSEDTYVESEPGSALPFTTHAAPPEVVGESASIIGERSGWVTLAAVIDPNNSKQETTYYFEYASEANGEELEGTIGIAESTGTIPAEEFGERTVTSAEVEVVPVKTTVYYRIVATNETGTTRGKVESYTKLPIVISESTSELTLTEATLQATLNPNWQATKYHFEYATSETTLQESKGVQVPGGVTSTGEFVELPVSAIVYGLTPRTHYYYRIVAENESSENIKNANKGKPLGGAIEHFTTESLPVVGTGEAQNITRTSATLSGTVTPIDRETTYYFQYISEAGYQAALAGDTEEKGDPFTASETTTPLRLTVSTAPQAVGPLPASGLLPEETYHYRLVATNNFGAEYGEPHTFRTEAKAPPVVATGPVSGVSQNSATLSGTVATSGLQTEYGFEIGTSPGNYGPVTGLGSIGGSTTEAVSLTLGELQPGTTYYYRVTASSVDGTRQGEPVPFTTPGFPSLIAPPASPPLVAYTSPGFPAQEKGSTGTTVKALTSKEKLENALKACKRDKSKNKRSRCEKQAKSKYAGARSKNSK
jgi:hypothetical protein